MSKKDDKYEIETEVREVDSNTYKGVESMLEENERWLDADEGGLELFVRQEGGRLKKLVIKEEEKQDD